ncbi:MAG: RIP metalloprotease RseP [Clostridiales bacterium]|mgnify:CR=1 FL=1|nr:RIP metalloprotease RseP [Clostridiales bacterium]
MLNILIALIFLSIIIMIHELGHFLTGKFAGIYIEEFSIGMGPRLLKYGGEETVYSLRAFPIGGYVKFLGEDDEDSDPRAFNNASVFKRFIVIASGAIMNFIFAILLLSIVFSTYGVNMPIPTIEEVLPGSPAHDAGLQANDVILGVDNVDIQQLDGDKAIETIRSTIDSRGNKSVNINVLRDGQYKSVQLTPVYDENEGIHIIGIRFGYEHKKLNFGNAILLSGTQIGKMATMMLKLVGNLIFKREGLDQITGPVGIVGEIGRAAEAGIEPLMYLAIIISLNLGIINLIPFPALDGGRLLLLLIEAIRGKPMDREKEGLINLIGFALLILLMIVVTFKDIKG